MAAREVPIRQDLDTSEFDGITLDTLKSALDKANPELIQNAAGEFRSARALLSTLIEKLDKHLRSFDEHWTAGEDAKLVKAQLRRLRESAQSVVDTIEESHPPGKTGPFAPKGVAPALEMYSSILKAFRGDHIPEKADKDVSFLEGAYQGGMAGGAAGGGVGFFVGGVGAVPGAAIGAILGTVTGGVSSLFTDGPFMNMFGDSKMEQDMKAAKEHLRKLTEATAEVNQVFPGSIKTDIPEFTPPNLTPPTVPASFGDKNLPGGGGYPPGGVQGYDPFSTGSGFPPPGSGPNGLSGGDLGGPGGNVPGANGPGWNDPGQNGPGWNDPGQNGPGWNDPGQNGPGWNDPGQNGPGGAGGTGANGSGANGSGAGGQGGNGTDPAGGSGRDTQLAGYDAQARNLAAQQGHLGNLDQQNLLGNAGQHSSSGGGGGNSTTGVGPLTQAGAPGSGSTFGHGAGGEAAGGRGANGLRAPGAGTGFMVPPHGGAGAKEDPEERERTIWDLEDDALFMSDTPVTSSHIDGTPKGRT